MRGGWVSFVRERGHLLWAAGFLTVLPFVTYGVAYMAKNTAAETAAIFFRLLLVPGAVLESLVGIPEQGQSPSLWRAVADSVIGGFFNFVFYFVVLSLATLPTYAKARRLAELESATRPQRPKQGG